MSAEFELPNVTKIAVLQQTDSVARRVRRNVRRNFPDQTERDQHLLAAKYFLDLLTKSVAWGVSEGRWDSFNTTLPTLDQIVEGIILKQLVDKHQSPIVLDKTQFGEGIKSFRYLPTVIPTLWIQETVSQVYQEPITTRTLLSQTALPDLP